MFLAQSLITLTQWEKKSSDALLSSPCPTCWAAETFPEEKKKPKNQNRNQTKNLTKKTQTNPKHQSLPTEPTYDLYRLKVSQQDRRSPGMIHFTAQDPSPPGPSPQHWCCRWALATAALCFPSPFPMAGWERAALAGIWMLGHNATPTPTLVFSSLAGEDGDHFIYVKRWCQSWVKMSKMNPWHA